MAHHEMTNASLKNLDLHEECLSADQEDRLLEIEEFEVELIASGDFDAVMEENEQWLADVLAEERLEAAAGTLADELDGDSPRHAA